MAKNDASVSNQSDGEFFALEKTGRDGVSQMLDKMHGEIIGAAAASIQRQPSVWMQRAFLYVVNNENMKDVISHRRGIYSIYKCFLKASQMGLQLGGQFPHAHLVPFSNRDNGGKKEAELIPTADGYRFAAVHGPQPVLRDATFRPVYESDEISIDQGRGEVSHKVKPGVERGKILGVYGKLEKLDGSAAVEWVSVDDIIAVRDNHSAAWKNNRPTGWKSDFEQMALKTAAKRILKPYAAEAEGLSMLLAADEIESDPQPQPPRDVTDRMQTRLDDRLGAIDDPIDTVDDPEPESEPSAEREPEEKTQPQTSENADGPDLF